MQQTPLLQELLLLYSLNEGRVAGRSVGPISLPSPQTSLYKRIDNTRPIFSKAFSPRHSVTLHNTVFYCCAVSSAINSERRKFKANEMKCNFLICVVQIMECFSYHFNYILRLITADIIY